MSLQAVDIRAAHALLGSATEVLHDRRTLYRALADVTGESAESALDDETLDNPMVRAHLGARFVGADSCLDLDYARVSAHVAPGYSVDVVGWPVRMASTAGAAVHVAPALVRINDVLRRADPDSSISVLTVGEGECAERAFAALVRGALLVAELVRDIAVDLLPHVGLFVIVARDPGGRLGSASEREFPGMIVLPEPESDVAAAEAIVHEGAHQKFFDLAITHSLLEEGHWNVPGFRPSWAPPHAPAWPFEQCCAAWHAYCCLAVLAEQAARVEISLHVGSLLPHAEHRASEICDWLLANPMAVGVDGRRLIERLSGRAFPVRRPRRSVSVVDPAAIYPSGRRALLVGSGAPRSLSWTTIEA